MSLPVWLYWEGPCPEWIRACQQTIFAHGADVRLLGPAQFDQLRQEDRDIDLSPLYVAHRADFARAYLLAHYGGLWVDSDCLVLRSLQPVLDLLERFDFTGHFERQGRISNGFIAARPGSRIAAAYYRRVCAFLRSGQAFSWMSLGAYARTEAIHEAQAPWFRLGYELVQPVCWSDPGKFFVSGPAADHQRAYNPRAFCYMLSNNTLRGYQAEHPGLDLLADDTFFSYLLRRALAKETEQIHPRRTAVGTSNWQQIPFCVEAMLAIAPLRALDVGIGFGRWGMLVREFCEEWQGRVHRENWQVWLEGIEIYPENIEEYQHMLYNWIHVGDCAEIIAGMDQDWDLIIFGDVLDHLPKQTAWNTLQIAIQRSGYVLLNIPVGPGWQLGAAYGNPYEEKRSFWEVEEFLALAPLRHVVYCESGGRAYATFLFSQHDPRHLGLPAAQSAAQVNNHG